MPKKKPTLRQMGIHFGRAMDKWRRSKFKLVSKEEYIQRRLICTECNGGWRCPRCGCQIWAKAALFTESCEKWIEKKNV